MVMSENTLEFLYLRFFSLQPQAINKDALTPRGRTWGACVEARRLWTWWSGLSRLLPWWLVALMSVVEGGFGG